MGRDSDPVTPHMFYQACKVSGKNSTTCKERRSADGTSMIEITVLPENDMIVR